MRKQAVIGSLALSCVVAMLWLFPDFWFTRVDSETAPLWLEANSEVNGYEFKEVDVAESAENLLVADQLFNGEFAPVSDGSMVRAFSANRYSERSNDIGLFVHTPDRCWTQGGWKMEVAEPEFLELDVHGVAMLFERRIFVAGGHRELVYFGGLVGGQQLPYRLDHNYSVGLKYAVGDTAKKRRAMGAGMRAFDKVFWGRIWDGFVSRRPLSGPKQFIRVSIGLDQIDASDGDQILQEFLPQWLKPVDYEAELAAWRNELDREEG